MLNTSVIECLNSHSYIICFCLGQKKTGFGNLNYYLDCFINRAITNYGNREEKLKHKVKFLVIATIAVLLLPLIASCLQNTYATAQASSNSAPNANSISLQLSYGGLDVKAHKVTPTEIKAYENSVGVYQEGRDYNLIVNGHGTGLTPPTASEWADIAENAVVIDDYHLKGHCPTRLTYPSQLGSHLLETKALKVHALSSQTCITLKLIRKQKSINGILVWQVGFMTAQTDSNTRRVIFTITVTFPLLIKAK
jgi:hypothetical protein